MNCNRRLIKFIQLSNLLLLLLWFLWLIQSKSVDWFLYDNGLRHKRVNKKKRFMFVSKRLCTIEHKIMTGFSKRNSVFGAINWINIFFLAFYIPLLGLYSCITFLKLKNDKAHKSDVNTLPMFFYGQALDTISPCWYQ